jgi:hypothetical protein
MSQAFEIPELNEGFDKIITIEEKWYNGKNLVYKWFTFWSW